MDGALHRLDFGKQLLQLPVVFASTVHWYERAALRPTTAMGGGGGASSSSATAQEDDRLAPAQQRAVAAAYGPDERARLYTHSQFAQPGATKGHH